MGEHGDRKKDKGEKRNGRERKKGEMIRERGGNVRKGEKRR